MRTAIYYRNIRRLNTFTSLVCIALASSPAFSADKQKEVEAKAIETLADSVLELGYSTGKLIWVSTTQPSLHEGVKPNVYSNLALNVQKRIDEGRASAQAIGANLNFLSATLTYSAVVDPEPLTKGVAAIGAFAAKKTGEYLVEETIKDSQKRAMGVLAIGLKNSRLTNDELRDMNSDQIRQHVADFQVGGKQIKEILDDPASLELLQDHMIDMVNDNALEALRRTDALEMSAGEVKSDLKQAREEITKIQNAFEERTTRIEAKMSALADAVEDNTKRLNALEGAVNGNTKAISSLAEISFSGWTTQQKLQAVRTDLFPDLSEEQKTAMIDSLMAQQKQEKLISEVSSIAGDLKSISAIASSLNLPDDVVKATSAAATVATGAVQFLSGDYLGAVGSITSLAGMGKPDAGAERHRQMMMYLAKQFQQINKKLDKIIDLQVKTIEALETLRKEQQEFRVEVLTKLDHIESITLANTRILQALVRNQWNDCDALVSNGLMNGSFTIADRQTLLKMISENTQRGNATSCYVTMSRFLDARVLPGDWAGQVIAANASPGDLVPADDVIHQKLIKQEQLDEHAFRTAARLVLLSVDIKRPANILARVAQPLATTREQQTYIARLAEPSVANELGSFTCENTKTLSTGLKELLCFEAPGNSSPPKPDRIAQLFNTALLGPQVERVIKEGVLMATFADLSYSVSDQIRLVRPDDIENIASQGLSTRMKLAIANKNGLTLLLKLRRLSESFVVQQGVAYGDYTAQLAFEALYDKSTHTLNVKPTDAVAATKAQVALDALRANPALARNVVLLALRQVIADREGGLAEAERVNFLEMRYRWSVNNFTRGDRCANDQVALTEWNSMFPGWTVEYRAKPDEKATPAFANCALEQSLDYGDIPKVALGFGPAVKLADDFYITLPSSIDMATGHFERPESLLRALALRDKVNQAISEREMSETIALTAAEEADPKGVRQRVAYDLLNATLTPTR